MKWPVYGGAVRDWCGGYVYEIQDIDVEKPENLDIAAAEMSLYTKANLFGWNYLGFVPKGRHCREFYFSWKTITQEK